MPGTKKIKDLMVPVSEYPVVYDTDTLKDAIKVLKSYLGEHKEHRSMVVLSREGSKEKITGILSVRDILFALKSKTMCQAQDVDYTMSWSRLYHAGSLCTIITKVGEAISPLVAESVQSEQDVSDAIRILMTHNINILPVVEGEKLVGIIRAIDILDYIGDLL